MKYKKMRTLGLIGGTSWHSTIEYYKYINQYVNDYFSDNTNPPLIVFTLNQSLIHRFQRESNWEGIAELIAKAAKSLENAGVDMLMLCANTPHKVYNKVEKQINTPILHISDATAEAIKLRSLNKVCFLGTKYSMTENFVTERIINNGVEVVTPSDENIIEELHRIIQEELTYGEIIPKSKEYVISIIQSFIDMGAEGVILGCTEFPLMIKETDLQIPIFNTTEIHSKAGANFILKDLKNQELAAIG